MSKFIITGPNKLSGEISVAGAKNSALKAIAATVLTDQEVILKNIPSIEDVHVMFEILKDLGGQVEKVSEHEYKVKVSEIKKTELDKNLVAKLRASIMFLAPLLTRVSEVKFPFPGGDIIGKRPIDIYLDGLDQFGVEIKYERDYYHLKKTSEKLKATKFVFPIISHTVTESLIMAAVLAEGKTTLVNTACEPEVTNLVEFLNSLGAKITGAGTPNIEIEGVSKLSGGEFTAIPDRIETGTFAILGALTGGDLKITNCNPSHLETFWKILEKIGVNFEIGKDTVKINPSNDLKAHEVRTHEYPGFATDLQAPATILLTQAKGLSMVYETIYEGRLFYTDMLNKMGANIIMCDPHRIVIQGPTKFYGAKLESPDIRAGIALVIAALIADGKSEIDNIYQVDRGYEKIEERLKTLGAKIERQE
ncbi:MAG: UDP-N-acetylglucosamine 1-carboxyvinyltransferase [Patescibacteria group bacterium]|nr:UDP-N-acetylglucosamine 1-carboxyvinyltransferase [Patescibacteria group bacterium]